MGRLSQGAGCAGAVLVVISLALISSPADANPISPTPSGRAFPWYVMASDQGSAESPENAANTAHAASPTQSVTDSPGNVYYAAPPARLVPSPTSDPADLVSATASEDGANLTFSAKTVALNDPSTDPNWRNATYIAWAIDPNFTGTATYFVYFQLSPDGSYNGELTYAATDAAVSCAVNLKFDASAGYQAVLSRACLPGVSTFQWLAYSLYDPVPLAQDPNGAQGFGKAIPDTYSNGGVEFAPPVSLPPTTSASLASGLSPGYWMFASDGGVFNFGDAGFYGSEGGHSLNQPVVGGAATLDGQGYWEAARDGGIFAFGDARFYGSTGGIHLNAPIVSMIPLPKGTGYWLVASDGGIFTFGGARFYGSEGGTHLNRPVVGGASTPDGLGYWLVASDGGIFAFGDAAYYGSTGASHLNKPVVGMAADSNGGYWLAASDGGVFNFGAPFFGSTGAIKLVQPVEGIAGTPDGSGYRLVSSDGGIFVFGDAPYLGSEGGMPLNKPVVSLSTIG